MSTSGDVQYIGVFNRKVFTNLLPHMHHDIPPMYYSTSPDVLTLLSELIRFQIKYMDLLKPFGASLLT